MIDSADSNQSCSHSTESTEVKLWFVRACSSPNYIYHVISQHPDKKVVGSNITYPLFTATIVSACSECTCQEVSQPEEQQNYRSKQTHLRASWIPGR